MPVLTTSRVLVVLFCFASLGAPACAQERKDPQSTVEPRSKPGVGQQFLARMVGDWDVTKTFYPRNGGDPAVTKGQCHQHMIHGGRFLESDFTFGQGDGRTTGTGIIGFEPDKGVFTSVWADSRATGISLRQSKDKFNGEEISLQSQALPAAGPNPRQSRTVTRIEDGGSKIVHRQYNAAPDGKDRLIMELVMIRKSDNQPAAR